MELGLRGRVALVTGAARGIGRAIAEALAAEGARVALASRDVEGLEAAAGALRAAGAEAIAAPFDMTVPATVDAALAGVVAALGPPEILVHSAWTRPPMGKLYMLDDAHIGEVLDHNLAAAARLMRRVLPGMMERRHGRVVVVGSIGAAVGLGKAPLYCATKAGLEGLCRNVAIDYARYGITANVVAPGFIDTERLRMRAPAAEQRELLRRATTVGRLGRPEEVAAACAFLCSDAAAYVTGVVLPVAGGAGLGNLW